MVLGLVMEDRDNWPGSFPRQQYSMRRSRLSGEMEQEGGDTAGSSSMTPRYVTPLTPLTPLKWKSSIHEEDRQQEKNSEPSTLGTKHTRSLFDHGEYSAVAVISCEEDGEVGVKHQQHMEDPSSEPVLTDDETQPIDKISQKQQLQTEEISDSNPPNGHERNPSSGEDVMMTKIEFLRARLLSERAASKAAKQQVQELNKKVMELEDILAQTVHQRQKAERAAEEAISKLKIASVCTENPIDASGMVQALESLNMVKGAQATAAPTPQTQESLVQGTSSIMSAEEKTQQEQHGTSDRDAINFSLTQDVNVANSSTSYQQSVAASLGNGLKHAEVLDACCTPQKLLETSGYLTQNQELSAALEDRLRNMWSQISKEITALSEERSKEDHICSELITWMCQVPAIIVATTSRTPCQNSESAKKIGSIIDPHAKIGDKHSPLEIEDAPTPLEEHQKEVDTFRTGVQNIGAQIKGTQNQYNPHWLSSGELQETPGEGLGRRQLQLLWEKSTIHNPHLQYDTTPNLMSEQIMSYKQSEGNTRGSQMEKIPGNCLHRRLKSVISCSQGDKDFGIASRQLKCDGADRKSQGNYFAGKQYHHPQQHMHSGGENEENGFSKEEPQLCFGYGHDYDAPKELALPVVQLCHNTGSISARDMLQTLHRVKMNIQGSSCPKNVPNMGMIEYNRYGEGDPSLHLRSGYKGEATAPVKQHQLRQAPPAPSVQEKPSRHNNNLHKKKSTTSLRLKYQQQQQLGDGGSRAPRVLQSLDSQSAVRMMYNNDPYSHTSVGQRGIITSSSLDCQQHHSLCNTHSKLNISP